MGVFYSADFKLDKIEQFLKSNMTMLDFSASIGVKNSTFATWLTKYRNAKKEQDEEGESQSTEMIDVTDQAKNVVYGKVEDPRKICFVLNGFSFEIDRRDVTDFMRGIKNA